MNNEPKKKSHLKLKIILGLIGAIALIGIGFMIGLRLQRAYNRFLYNAGSSMVSLYLYGTIFILLVVLFLILFIFFKLRGRGK